MWGKICLIKQKIINLLTNAIPYNIVFIKTTLNVLQLNPPSAKATLKDFQFEYGWRPKLSICSTNFLHILNRYVSVRSGPPEVFLGKSVLKICSKFIGGQPFNFIEIILWYGCSTVNLLHIFRTPFPDNTYEGLVLVSLKFQFCLINLFWNLHLKIPSYAYLFCISINMEIYLFIHQEKSVSVLEKRLIEFFGEKNSWSESLW